MYNIIIRLIKDLKFSIKETNEQKAKIEKMKTEDGDEYDIKKQIEVLQEYQDGIPDCVGRIQDAIMDLEDLLEEIGEVEEVKSCPYLKEAVTLMIEMKDTVKEMKK